MAGWGTGNVEVQITWPPHSRTPALRLESLASDGASESSEEGLMSGYASLWPWGRLDSNTFTSTKILGLGAEKRQMSKNEKKQKKGHNQLGKHNNKCHNYDFDFETALALYISRQHFCTEPLVAHLCPPPGLGHQGAQPMDRASTRMATL